jgi:hypothetical protein
MSSDESKLESSSVPQRVNPYETSAFAEPRVSRESPYPSEAPRTFSVRLHWSDRRRFLRAVGPLRVIAVASGVVAIIGIYSLVNSIITLWGVLAISQTWQNVETTVRWSLSLLRGGVLIYVAWLQGRFAEAIAAAAGGRTSDMDQWSDLQLRLAHWGVAVLAIGLVVSFWDAIVNFVLLRGPSLP